MAISGASFVTSTLPTGRGIGYPVRFPASSPSSLFVWDIALGKIKSGSLQVRKSSNLAVLEIIR